MGAAGASVGLKKQGLHCWAYYFAFSGTHFSSGMIVLTGDTQSNPNGLLGALCAPQTVPL